MIYEVNDLNGKYLTSLEARSQEDANALVRNFSRHQDAFTVSGQLATMLKRKYRGVKYNSVKREGSADVGGILVSFHESSNENAVWVEITIKKVKAEGAEEMMQFIASLQASLRKI